MGHGNGIILCRSLFVSVLCCASFKLKSKVCLEQQQRLGYYVDPMKWIEGNYSIIFIYWWPSKIKNIQKIVFEMYGSDCQQWITFAEYRRWTVNRSYKIYCKSNRGMVGMNRKTFQSPIDICLETNFNSSSPFCAIEWWIRSSNKRKKR